MHHFQKREKVDSKSSFFLIIIAILIMVICTSFIPWSTLTNLLTSKGQHPKEIAAKHYRNANRAYQAGKTKKAIRYLKKAMSIDQANEVYINKLAEIYHQEGKFKQALTYLTKTREIIQDSLIKQAVQMMNWEGCYALSNGLRKAAILRFEEAVHTMDKYFIVDSLLKSSIYCNWGVAELYDQAKNYPCDTSLLGE